MLTSIEIAGEATYPAGGGKLSELRKINYLFGHNGCGKTTVSRAIHDVAARPGYALAWKDGREIATLVYNQDFAEANFGDQMKGIFTLGEDTTKTVEDIATLQAELLKIGSELDGIGRNLDGVGGLGGRRSELISARSALEKACWESHRAHKYFEEGYSPHRSSKSAFCTKLLEEQQSNKAELLDLETLKSRTAMAFQPTAPAQSTLAVPKFEGFDEIESHDILSRRIVGRDDAVVAALINQLGNSDWVKQGMAFIEAAEGSCPFCQQPAPPNLIDQLNTFFDAKYEADLAQIDSLSNRYEAVTLAVSERVSALSAIPNHFLDGDAFAERYTSFRSLVELNQSRLDSKRKEPSSSISLEPTGEAANAILEMIAQANAAIDAYNATIADLANSQKTVRSQIWRFTVEERQTDLTTFATSAQTIQKAIDGLERSIAGKKNIRDEKAKRLLELEASVTSVKPTVDAVNRILAMYGFQSFRLAVAGVHQEMYRIERLDGTSAAKTLSEGERSFVTFLYFYHLLAGSTSGAGTTAEKVVVFDDPVSSLDSDVLFIVSALIRKVVADVCIGTGPVRQVFVLTHNIYFHKEVSYDRKRNHDGCLKHETFWIVRKRDNVSSLHRYEHNPIRTSYELLWDEVRNPDRPKLTIQNTLRRIVENYLIILGGWDPESIVACFNGKDAQVCASLFSWINDGSHTAQDDLYLAADDHAVEGYLRVFAEVFRETGQEAHYKMMMRSAEEDDATPAPAPAPA